MSTCPRSTRDHADRVKADLEACDDVLGAAVLDPNEGPPTEWTLEATITGDRLPPEAVQVLADQDCAVISTTLRAPEALHLVASV